MVKPFFFFYKAKISDCNASHYILIEYCFLLTVLSQIYFFNSPFAEAYFCNLKWEWNCMFTWRVKNIVCKI